MLRTPTTKTTIQPISEFSGVMLQKAISSIIIIGSARNKEQCLQYFCCYKQNIK
jgi:hypothetical protein